MQRHEEKGKEKSFGDVFLDICSSLQNQYRSDLNWMKGVGWETEGCLNITQAKKAGELLSDVSGNVLVFIF